MTDTRSEADVVQGICACDREALDVLYAQYADCLFDLALSLLRDPDEAAEATYAVFAHAGRRMHHLRDPQRLRAWLYALCRAEATERLREHSRPVADERVVPLPPPLTQGPVVRDTELRDLAWVAARALPDRDRAMLDLHQRHGLTGSELADAMDVNPGASEAMLSLLQQRVERTIGTLLAVRLRTGDCAALEALLGGWDGKFSPLLRRDVADHFERCAQCGASARPSAWELLAQVSLTAAPESLRDRVRSGVELTGRPAPSPQPAGSDDLTVPPDSAVARLLGAGAPGGNGATPDTNGSGPLGPATIPPGGSGPSGSPASPPDAADPPPPGLRRLPGALRRHRRLVTVLGAAVGAAIGLVVVALVLRFMFGNDSEESEPISFEPAPAQVADVPDGGRVLPGPLRTGGLAGGAAQAPGAALAAPAPPEPAPPAAGPPGSPGGGLSVIPAALDLADVSAGFVELHNPGAAALTWTATPGADWLTAAPTGGTLPPDGRVRVAVAVASAGLAEGDHETVLTVTGADRTVQVPVRSAVDRPPIVGDVELSPLVSGSGCPLDAARVAVTVTDDVGVTRVVAAFTHSGGVAGSTELARAGERWVGDLGPFTQGGTVVVVVEASDARGNSTAVDAGQITVVPCPLGG